MGSELKFSKPFKYDPSVTEFFVQTSDTVRVKVSDLERWQEQEMPEDEAWLVSCPFVLLVIPSYAKAMPDQPLQQKELMPLEKGPGKDAAGTDPGTPGPGVPHGATPMDSTEEMKVNLKAFTDSVHQKGSQLVTMIQGVEGQNTERSTQCVKIMAAEHRYKLLVGDPKTNKKRARADAHEKPEADEADQTEAPEPKAKGKAKAKVKAKAKASA
eukprot:Skav206469  [mRNA]  locus=scaffold1672:101096:102421:- [translate_table: standard]